MKYRQPKQPPLKQNSKPDSPLYPWLVLGLLVLIYILSFVDRQIIAVLATQIRAELSLSNMQVGLLYGTAFSVIYAVAGIPMGRLADRWSRRAMIAGGLFLWSAMTVASGLVSSVAALVVFRMLLGLSQAMLSPAAYALMADYFAPEKRATVFSIYASGIFLGIGSSFLVGGTIAQQTDWRTAMIAVGLPGLVLAPVAFFVIRGSRAQPDAADAEAPAWGTKALSQIQWFLKKPTVLLHLIGFSALACTGYTGLAFIGTVLTDVHDRPDLVPHYGWFLFGVGATVILSGKIADMLARRHPARRFLMGIVAALAGVPFYYFGLFVLDGMAAFLCLGVAVLFSSSYNGVAAALIQYFAPPQMRALAGGLYLFVISVAGFGFGPPFAGWLMDAVFDGPKAPASALFTVIAGCGVLATGAFLWAMKTYDRDEVRDG